MTNVECANAVMDILMKGVSRSTSSLKNELDLSTEHQANLRFVLNRLAKRDVIVKMGNGVNKWKAICSEWTLSDRSSPFGLQTTKADRLKHFNDKVSYSNESKDKAMASFGSYPAPTGGPYLPQPKFETPDTISAKVAQNQKVLGDAMILLEKKVNSVNANQEEVYKTITEIKKIVQESKEVAQRSVATLKIEQYDGKVIKLKDKVLPKDYEKVLDLARCRRNIMLVGPAGCGKTFFGKLVADSLGLKFGSLSCTSGMSESHLLGWGLPDIMKGDTQFQSTEFLDCYENGGLHLLDEIDAADPNLLLALNSALANGYCNVPSRKKKPRAVRHKDYVCMVTANTYGRGANRVYAGRTQLDEATLDRFRMGMVEIDYDEVIEAALCPDDELRKALQEIRKKINGTGLRRIMSSRFMEDAYIMRREADWPIERILETFFLGWSNDEKAKVQLPKKLSEPGDIKLSTGAFASASKTY